MTIAELQQAYLFKKLAASELETIASAAQEAVYEAGEYVYKEGDRGETFYVITEGKVELIAREQGNTACVYGHVSAGGHFGEISLFTGKPRSLSVRTITKVRVLCFDHETFESVLLANPVLHRAFDQALAERLVISSKGAQDFGITVKPIRPSIRESSPTPHIGDTGPAPGQTAGINFQEEIDLTSKIRSQIERFAADSGPLLITGEPGTGRKLVAKQIHLHSDKMSEPSIELDLCRFDPWIWEEKLFGRERDAFPYSPGRQLGVFEQLHHGTVVLYNAEHLSKGLQNKLYEAVTTGRFSTIDGKGYQPFRVRLIFIAGCNLTALENESVFIPELIALLSDRVFSLPPLREHKRDIKTLVDYYLKRYSAEYNKGVTNISPDALGLLMNYHWPGNLTELSNVIQRAVMLTEEDQIISEQILLGLPRTEGRLVYNLLRIPKVRSIIESRLYPVLPKIIVSIIFGIGILTLFLDPQEPEKNFGLALSWYVGWPLLIASFFFLPRFWCSVCALSAPGKLVQKFIQPTRRLPSILTANSNWIMAILCLVVFWVEVVWNAYQSPWLTAMILLTITFGALLFSILFQRYAWCRYVCPLGGLNAIFSMPSILELRANRQMCENQCTDHACYRGTNETPGCPMFRHPFLVDNNKDCILCGRCIKNCRYRSTQLNLRLAPRELWSIQEPRHADSFLIVALGAVFFLMAQHGAFQSFIHETLLFGISNSHVRAAITGTLVFWGIIALAWIAYSLLCWIQAVIMSMEYQKVRAALGYGLIPLVLGGYLAFYTKMFFQGGWRLVPNFLLLFGIETTPAEFHFISQQGISTILNITILGGMLACLYSTYKIFSQRDRFQSAPVHRLLVPFLCILAVGFAYLMVI